MYILRVLALFFLAQGILAQQPTPILPDSKLTPGDTFDVTAQDVCVPGYAKKVRAVPAWLKRQAYAEYGVTQYKTGDYEVDHLTRCRWEVSVALSISVSADGNVVEKLHGISWRGAGWANLESGRAGCC
jgi:hypothetical protein